MVDMLVRCGAKDKTDFYFFDTGLEYRATHDHLDFLEKKYGITINRVRAKKSIPTCIREYGAPFWSKFASEMIYRLQKHGFKWEDKPFDELYKEYPKCKTALEWWCNVSTGNTTHPSIPITQSFKNFVIYGSSWPNNY